MVKIDNNFKPNQTPTNPTDNSSFANQTHQSSNQKSHSGLLTMIGQLLPLAPFAWEQFTGQKVPLMTGTLAEMQTTLINIQTNLQVIVQNQQALGQRISQLETNASNQLTNLTHQFKSLRLTHTKEQKQIEYNNPPHSEENEDY